MDSTQQMTYLVLKDTPGKGWLKDQHVTMSRGDAQQWVDRKAIELDEKASVPLVNPPIRTAMNSDTPESLAAAEKEAARKREENFRNTPAAEPADRRLDPADPRDTRPKPKGAGNFGR